MQSVYQKNKVYANVEASKGIFELTVRGDFKVKPGQFYMLRAWNKEPLLSRPISVHDVNGDKISFMYEVKGEGTNILSRLNCEDGIELLGPLGNGFNVDNIEGRIAVVTGGIGIAPMLYTAKNLNASTVDLYAGFRDDVYTVDKFKGYVDNIHIATDSGKSGYKGYITDIFSPVSYSMIMCCGPVFMMEKVVKSCIKHDVPVLVSMEKHMACGIGACLVCTCSTRNGNKRVCKDGPIFSGRDVFIYD